MIYPDTIASRGVYTLRTMGRFALVIVLSLFIRIAFSQDSTKLQRKESLTGLQAANQAIKSINPVPRDLWKPSINTSALKVPAIGKMEYKRPGKPSEYSRREWTKSKSAQQNIFKSVNLSYSSDSGFDPSLKNLGENEKSFLNSYNLKSDPLDALKGREKSLLNQGESQFNQGESHASQNQKEITRQLDNVKSNASASSLKGLDKVVAIKSEKLLQKYYDSLIQKDIKPPQPPAFMQKEMSKNDLVTEINKEFNEETKEEGDSIKDKTGALRDRAISFKNKAASVGNKADSVKNIDLTKYKLSRTDAGQLKPLAGGLMDNKIFKSIDSVRRLKLLEEGYSYKEKLLSQKDKLSQLKQKQTFGQKSYFEGLLGLQQNELTILQLSPALGYNLNKIFSIGAGPNVTLYTNKTAKLLTKASARTFLKAELWKQRFYLQAEDGLQLASAEGSRSIDHTALAGVGGLLPFSKSVALNVMVLYRVYRSDKSLPSSPLVFRVGISTMKDKKIKQK